MAIRGIHLEAAHHRSNIQVLAIHPGTTVSRLSEPFVAKTKLKLHTPEGTAANILSVIDRTPFSGSGRFFSWDGSQLPW